jgi:hypothetical protein
MPRWYWRTTVSQGKPGQPLEPCLEVIHEHLPGCVQRRKKGLQSAGRSRYGVLSNSKRKVVGGACV